MKSKILKELKSRCVNSALRSFLFLMSFFFLGTLGLYAQSVLIRGVVTDTQKEPLIGVSVKVVDSKKATITDIDGNYSIEANVGQKLEFSYVD